MLFWVVLWWFWEVFGGSMLVFVGPVLVLGSFYGGSRRFCVAVW